MYIAPEHQLTEADLIRAEQQGRMVCDPRNTMLGADYDASTLNTLAYKRASPFRVPAWWCDRGNLLPTLRDTHPEE